MPSRAVSKKSSRKKTKSSSRSKSRSSSSKKRCVSKKGTPKGKKPHYSARSCKGKIRQGQNKKTYIAVFRGGKYRWVRTTTVKPGRCMCLTSDGKRCQHHVSSSRSNFCKHHSKCLHKLRRCVCWTSAQKQCARVAMDGSDFCLQHSRSCSRQRRSRTPTIAIPGMNGPEVFKLSSPLSSSSETGWEGGVLSSSSDTNTKSISEFYEKRLQQALSNVNVCAKA